MFDVGLGIQGDLFHEFAIHIPATSRYRHGELPWEFGFEIVESQASARVVWFDDGEEAW